MSGVRIPLPRPILSGSLAQLVEQLTFNQLVAGSNPARPTTFKNSSQDGSLAQLVEQLTFNQLVAGSNPARPTIFSSIILFAFLCVSLELPEPNPISMIPS